VGYLSDNIVLAETPFIGLRNDGVLIVQEPDGDEEWFDLQTKAFLKKRSFVVKRLVQGSYKWNNNINDLEFVENNSVRFDHQYSDGHFMITSARLFKGDSTAPIMTLDYEYSKDWTLAKVSLVPKKQAKAGSSRRLASLMH
jgi:hypothetical protein